MDFTPYRITFCFSPISEELFDDVCETVEELVEQYVLEHGIGDRLTENRHWLKEHGKNSEDGTPFSIELQFPKKMIMEVAKGLSDALEGYWFDPQNIDIIPANGIVDRQWGLSSLFKEEMQRRAAEGCSTPEAAQRREIVDDFLDHVTGECYYTVGRTNVDGTLETLRSTAAQVIREYALAALASDEDREVVCEVFGFESIA